MSSKNGKIPEHHKLKHSKVWKAAMTALPFFILNSKNVWEALVTLACVPFQAQVFHNTHIKQGILWALQQNKNTYK